MLKVLSAADLLMNSEKTFKICIDVRGEEVLNDEIIGYMAVADSEMCKVKLLTFRVLHPFTPALLDFVISRREGGRQMIRFTALPSDKSTGYADLTGSIDRTGLDGDGVSAQLLGFILCSAIIDTLKFLKTSPFEVWGMSAVSLMWVYDVELPTDALMQDFERMLYA
jgi:hypothetical protein